mgnify:CR=1 FL=1
MFNYYIMLGKRNYEEMITGIQYSDMYEYWDIMNYRYFRHMLF